MEIFMYWALIYRDLAALGRLAATVPAAEIASREVYAEATGTIGYLVLNRA